MKFDFKELIKAALAAPAAPRVQLYPFDSPDAFGCDAARRVCAGFAQTNHAALTYSGPDATELQAALTDLDSQIEFHKNEVARLRAELLKQTGGADAAAAAAAAGLDIEFDPALISGQRAHEKQRYELSQKRAEVSSKLVTAQQSVRAKAELVSIVGALLGGLQ